MNTFTIEDKIKLIFQKNPTEREKRLTEYADSSGAKKTYMVEVICDEFLNLCDDMAIIKYEQFMEEVSNGNRQISTDIMSQAYTAVYQDFAQILTGKQQDNEEIKALQQKLQSLAG